MHQRTSIAPIDMGAFIVAILLYLIYVLSRIGLSDGVNLFPLLLSVSLLLLPVVLQPVFKLPVALLQFLALIFFFVLGWISILLSVNLSFVLYLTGIVPVFFFLRRVKFKINKWTFGAGVLIFILTLKLAAVLWGSYYLTPLAPEAYAIGHLHIDTLYLAGLTSMVKTYQVTTTGLFGLVPIEYHAGTSYFFAALSELCNLSAISFYNFAYTIVFIPLFLHSFMYAAFSNLKVKPSASRLIVGAVALFLVLGGFVSNDFGFSYLLSTTVNSHFISQSYCVSLILLFHFISVYGRFFRADEILDNPRANSIFILMIPFWIFAIGYAKISTGVILFVAMMYIFIRRKLLFKKWILVSMIASAVVLFYTMLLTVESAKDHFTILFGAFYKYFVKGNIILYFLFTYLWIVVLVAVLSFVLKKTRAARLKEIVSGKYFAVDARVAIVFLPKTPKYIVIETIIVAAIAGMIPGMFMEIEGGSAAYFSDIQNWLAGMTLVSVAPFFIYKLYKYRQKYGVAIRIFYFVVAVIFIRESVFRSFYYLVKQNLRIRSVLMYDKDERFALSGKLVDHPAFIGGEVTLSKIMVILKDCADPKTSSKFHEETERLKLSLMEELRELPNSLKRKSLIYCEDPEELPKFKDCGQSFYFTSMTGIALINGLYWKDCLPSGEYSFRYYKEYPAQVTKEEAVKLAKERGFSNLIVVNYKNKKYEMMPI